MSRFQSLIYHLRPILDSVGLLQRRVFMSFLCGVAGLLCSQQHAVACIVFHSGAFLRQPDVLAVFSCSHSLLTFSFRETVKIIWPNNSRQRSTQETWLQERWYASPSGCTQNVPTSNETCQKTFNGSLSDWVKAFESSFRWRSDSTSVSGTFVSILMSHKKNYDNRFRVPDCSTAHCHHKSSALRSGGHHCTWKHNGCYFWQQCKWFTLLCALWPDPVSGKQTLCNLPLCSSQIRQDLCKELQSSINSSRKVIFLVFICLNTRSRTKRLCVVFVPPPHPPAWHSYVQHLCWGYETFHPWSGDRKNPFWNLHCWTLLTAQIPWLLFSRGVGVSISTLETRKTRHIWWALIASCCEMEGWKEIVLCSSALLTEAKPRRMLSNISANTKILFCWIHLKCQKMLKTSRFVTEVNFSSTRAIHLDNAPPRCKSRDPLFSFAGTPTFGNSHLMSAVFGCSSPDCSMHCSQTKNKENPQKTSNFFRMSKLFCRNVTQKTPTSAAPNQILMTFQ